MNFFDICVQVGSNRLAPSLYPRRVTDYQLDIFCPSSIVRDDCGYSAVLTFIHNLCFEQNYENSKKNQLEIDIFTAVKYRCLLHGNVCVM